MRFGIVYILGKSGVLYTNAFYLLLITEKIMAKKKGGGFFGRMVIGSEKSEGYARQSLPSNRWELFWDIFKGKLGKLCIINLLMVLFFIPLVALILFRFMAVSGYGAMAPYSLPFGVGYQAPVSFVGYEENIMLTANSQMFLFLPIALLIAGIGISGGAYVIRNMVWTEGVFVANDFWKGVKQNFLTVGLIMVLYSLVFYLSMLGISYENKMLALGEGTTWLLQISKYVIIIFLALFTIMTLHMISMTITYKVTLRQLFKNSFILTFGAFIQNIVFVLLGVAPLLLMLLGSFFTTIGVMLIIFLWISYFLLLWTNYCHWLYDKFMNDNVPGAQKNRGMYQKVKSTDAEALKQYKEQLESATRSALSMRPIKPITDDELKIAELPTSFNRNDIAKLNESKKALYEDHERYVEEHKNDAKYQLSEQEEQTEKARLEREKRIEQAKRELAKRNKKGKR